jgi:hypothetical protein
LGFVLSRTSNNSTEGEGGDYRTKGSFLSNGDRTEGNRSINGTEMLT